MVVYFFVILRFARKLRRFYLLKLHLNVGKKQFNMPACSIVQCGARKNVNQPQLSLHRFPKNEGLKKKWLEAIGEENINLRQKDWYLCSLHFEESCFNKTLDVMRLRDNSVPIVFSAPDKKLHQESSVLCKMSNIKKSVVSFTPTVMDPLQLPHRIVETVHKEAPDKKLHQESSVLCKMSNIKKSVVSFTPTVMDPLQLPHQIVETVHKEAPDKKLHQESSVLCKMSNIKKSVVSFTPTVMDPLQSPHRIIETVHKEVVETENVKALKEKCVKQQQKIKRLTAMIGKKNKRIANLKDIVEDLRRKNSIIMKQAVVIEDLAGPKEVLKRQINKSKSLPTPNKYSKEVRNIAFIECVALVK